MIEVLRNASTDIFSHKAKANPLRMTTMIMMMMMMMMMMMTTVMMMKLRGRKPAFMT
jgi:hypothetical protein